WTGTRPGTHDILHVEAVIGVRRLKPGPAVVDVQVQRIYRSQVIVDAVEYIFFISLVMEDGEFRRVEKASGVEPVYLDKISPVLSAIGHVKSGRYRPKASVGTRKASRRTRHALSRPRCGHDYEAGLVAIFGRRRARDHFDGLNRIRWKLV